MMLSSKNISKKNIFLVVCSFFLALIFVYPGQTKKDEPVLVPKEMPIPDWKVLLEALERFKKKPNLTDYRIMTATRAFTEMGSDDSYFVMKTVALKLAPTENLPSFLMGFVMVIKDDCHLELPVFLRPDIYHPTERVQVLPLLERAAESGDVGIQRILALMYLNGDYVKKDIAKGQYWLKKSGIEPNGFDPKCKYLDVQRDVSQRQQNWYPHQ